MSFVEKTKDLQHYGISPSGIIEIDTTSRVDDHQVRVGEAVMDLDSDEFLAELRGALRDLSFD